MPDLEFGRTTAWRAIAQVMDKAEISGIQATPKGLRHSFVIHHQELGTPDHMIQRWLGWASRDMMEVYGRAVGKEEGLAGAFAQKVTVIPFTLGSKTSIASYSSVL